MTGNISVLANNIMPTGSAIYFLRNAGRRTVHENEEVQFKELVYPSMAVNRDYRPVMINFWSVCVDILGHDHPIVRENTALIKLEDILSACCDKFSRRSHGVMLFCTMIADAIDACPEHDYNIFM